MKRVGTGIKGLDKLIGGGIPERSIVLVTGGPGTGKTIFTLQYLSAGAAAGEKCLYLTFEEKEDKIIEQALQFDWKFDKHVKKGTIKIVNVSKKSFGSVLKNISEEIRVQKPKRVVVDSMSTFCLYAHSFHKLIDLEKIPLEERVYGDEANASPVEWDGVIMRKMLMDFMQLLNREGATVLATSEYSEQSGFLSRDTISEYTCDGVILLRATTMGATTTRTLEVKKLRNTEIVGGVHAFGFTKKGIALE